MKAETTRITRNRILHAIPASSLRRLQPDLEVITLDFRKVVYEAGEPIKEVLFPLEGVVSMVKELEDGSIIEVATIGSEGFVGLPLLLGSRSMPAKALQQVTGPSARMSASAFRKHLDRDADLRATLNRYTQALFNQVAQTAACNRSHLVTQRCARWLLMTHDRVESDVFTLTQDFLAQMLGIRRAGVNEAARALKESGAVRYSRGRVTVLDRAKLERMSCQCYAQIAEEYDRLLPKS